MGQHRQPGELPAPRILGPGASEQIGPDRGLIPETGLEDGVRMRREGLYFAETEVFDGFSVESPYAKPKGRKAVILLCILSQPRHQGSGKVLLFDLDPLVGPAIDVFHIMYRLGLRNRATGGGNQQHGHRSGNFALRRGSRPRFCGTSRPVSQIGLCPDVLAARSNQGTPD